MIRVSHGRCWKKYSAGLDGDAAARCLAHWNALAKALDRLDPPREIFLVLNAEWIRGDSCANDQPPGATVQCRHRDR